MENVLVTVIIPTYNRSKILLSAIDSVINQTYKNVEIIIIDDGSTDDTKTSLLHYGDKVKYFYQENSGPSSARNLGIKNSSGVFIAFLDSDDTWLPTKLEKQVRLMNSENYVGFVFCNISHFDQDGKCNWIDKYELDMPNNLPIQLLFRPIATPTVMIRRECFDVCGNFDESLKSSEDLDLFLRITLKYKAKLVDEILVHRNYVGDNITTNQNMISSMQHDNISVINKFYKNNKPNKYISKRIAYSKVYYDYSIKYKKSGNIHLFLLAILQSIFFNVKNEYAIKYFVKFIIGYEIWKRN